MQEKHMAYFLKISGGIAENKAKEFEQTIRFLFNQLPPECIERSLTEDVNNHGHYYFLSLWQNERSLRKFLESEEFQLIKGAYSALGYLEKTVHGGFEEELN